MLSWPYELLKGIMLWLQNTLDTEHLEEEEEKDSKEWLTGLLRRLDLTYATLGSQAQGAPLNSQS